MSKMPAKKKSCFQITSVTQAQVAASSVTDDTESLDDPDESRTEDVSSEIFDVSRADYEPVCDRSSSEEALNNVGETEAVGVMAPSQISQVGQLSALSSNPNGGFRNLGLTGSASCSQQVLETGAAASLPIVTQQGSLYQQQLAQGASAGGGSHGLTTNLSQSAQVTNSTPSSSTASMVSCSSRFRVIKLDHGTGEPFRRGRWTCTEFYEKDSEGSVVSRSDSIRHANATSDPSTDRDSGLGHTGGSVVAQATNSGQGLGSLADVSLSSSRMQQLEALQQQQIHHQTYGTGQQGGSGTGTQNVFSSSKSIAVSAQQQQPTVGLLQQAAPQNRLPVGHNTLPQGSINIQKSPGMPCAAQPQPGTYSHQQQQLPLGHHLLNQASALPPSQTEYYHQQQPTPLQAAVPTNQSLSVTSHIAGTHSLGQGPSQGPVMSPATGGTSGSGQGGEPASTGGGALPVVQAAPSLLQPSTGGMGCIGESLLVGVSPPQQQTVGQYTNPGLPQTLSLQPTPAGGQNVPVVAVSSSVPTTVPSASTSATMPNLTTSSLLTGQQSQPRSDTRALGGLGVQGLSAAGFRLLEAGRKSEGPANNNQPSYVPGKDLMKPLIPDSLQLSTPTVNSLFGIPIPVDGDEDSASGTSVVAIDNKIEQAMDLVKSHLMYAVREEVEVLKEQIKELFERNSMLERENAVLKSLANNDQLSQLSTQSASASSGTPPQQGLSQAQGQPQLQAPVPQSHPQLQQHPPTPQQLQSHPPLDPSQPLQPNVTSA